jgi:hypothetical protein
MQYYISRYQIRIEVRFRIYQSKILIMAIRLKAIRSAKKRRFVVPKRSYRSSVVSKKVFMKSVVRENIAGLKCFEQLAIGRKLLAICSLLVASWSQDAPVLTLKMHLTGGIASGMVAFSHDSRQLHKHALR